MTEEPPSDRIAPEPIDPPQPEALHEDAAPETSANTDDAPATDSSAQKAETIRDEIRAGWSRALRRG